MKININLIEKTCIFTLGALVTSFIFIFLFSSLWKYRTLDQTIKQASAHQYDSANYNCVDFSNAAVSLLQKKDIEAKTVVVKPDNGASTHAVISVLIDPQTGQFVNNEDSFLGDYNTLKQQYSWNE